MIWRHEPSDRDQLSRRSGHYLRVRLCLIDEVRLQRPIGDY